MKTVGIVCEYNPFHKGHEHQIRLLREKGAETVICAMSGNYTQRGELAIADKYTRAESALRCGVDLVVELPFPYSSLSAEGFCRAGVHILSSLGCDTLCFGSECADEVLLAKASEVVSQEDFVTAYAEAQKSAGSAKAYFDTLSRFMGQDTELLSNDILAISYLSAIRNLGSDMKPYPIKREGSAYTESKLEGGYPSATAIRKALKDGTLGFQVLTEAHLPAGSLETLKVAEARGDTPVFTEAVGREILNFFRMMSPSEIVSRAKSRSGGGDAVCQDGCGILERLCSVARCSADHEGFLQSAYNSRYTDARINRVILFSLFGVSEIFGKSLPDYTTLLAASERGRKYLSEIRKTATFPIVTKPADAPETALTDLIRLSDSFYVSAIPTARMPDFFMKKHPFMG